MAFTLSSAEASTREFFETFPYPWKAWVLDRPLDPDLYRIHLSQDIGDWAHGRIAEAPSIWVAGCGTNQAVITALRWPRASVVGSDLSELALRVEKEQIAAIGIENLELNRENITGVSYKQEFDFVICTGVLHHNPTPHRTLERLRDSLKPHGILELMVFNRFHRLAPANLQQAVQLLVGESTKRDWRREASVAELLVENFPLDNYLSCALSQYRHFPEEELIDAVTAPIAHSFTVASLATLASQAGLQLILPCPNRFDLVDDRYCWDLEFRDPQLARCFDQLSDIDRWQVVNLLAFEKSPMLWFYFQRSDTNTRTSESEINDEFLSTSFIMSDARAVRFARDRESGNYVQLSEPVAPIMGQGSHDLKRVIDEVARAGGIRLRDAFATLGVELTRSMINRFRVGLTSSLFPYLRAETTSTTKADVGSNQNWERRGLARCGAEFREFGHREHSA